MSSNRYKRYQSLVVLLSLLIHLGIAVILFIPNDEQNALVLSLLPEEQEKVIPVDTWYSCGSPHEAQIILVDEPAPEQSSPITHAQPQQENIMQHPSARPPAAHKSTEEKPVIAEQQKPSPETEPQIISLEPTRLVQEKITDQDTQTKSIEKEEAVEPSTEPVQQPIEQVTSSQPAQNQQPSDEQSPTHQQKLPSLADIAQGFIKSMHHERGTDKYEQDTKKMSEQIYASKIFNMLSQAFKTESETLFSPRAISTKALLIISIEKDGRLAHIELQHPRKTPELQNMEQLFITTAHKVGLFPPLPQSFNADRATFSLYIKIDLEKGMGRYFLHRQFAGA